MRLAKKHGVRLCQSYARVAISPCSKAVGARPENRPIQLRVSLKLARIMHGRLASIA